MLTDDELRAAYDGADQSTAGWHILGLRAVADAVLAKAIPPGFVVVPAEPTKAMLAAADKIMDCAPRWVARGYRAMIEAAPPPSAPEPSRTLTQDERDVFDAAERRSTKVVVPEPSEAQVEAAWRAIPASHEDSRVSVITKGDVWVMLRAAAAARNNNPA